MAPPITRSQSVSEQGLPYIPRVHLSEGSLVRSPLRWLCSEEPMVRRSYIPKFLYSESCYVPKIPYSERPPTIWILCYEGSLVRSSSSPKVLCSELPYSENRPSPYEFYITKVLLSEVPPALRLLCSEDSIFRTSPVVYGLCVAKVLYSESFKAVLYAFTLVRMIMFQS